MSEARRARRPVVALGAALLGLLVGCSSEGARQQMLLDELAQRLPGRFDSAASADTVALTFRIIPVNALNAGRTLLYAQQSVADDPRRLLGQQIWSFGLDKNNRVLMQVLLFKEPRRWLGAAEDPQKLQALLLDDLLPLSGCELAWQREGAALLATLAPACKPGTSAAGLWIDQRVQLDGATLKLAEQRVGEGGALRADQASAQYQFERAASRAN